MALSLDQVGNKSKTRAKKKTAAEKTKAAAPREPAAEPAPKKPARKKPVEESLSVADTSTKVVPPRPQVRPWSKRGLAKEGRSPKERLGTNHHMNEDWINLHESPLFWIDLSESRIAKVQEKLHDLEQKATSILQTPSRILARARKSLRSLIR